MAKPVSITVHPSALSDGYLTVSDAMRQILDIVGALEGIEASDETERKIVWRLTGAHTHSPPFTVVAEAFPKDPQISVEREAERVTDLYTKAVSAILAGDKPRWLENEAVSHLKRAFERNLNGVGHTEVRIADDAALAIMPNSARTGLSAIERAEIDSKEDTRRNEYGSVEGQVIGLTKHYSSPALIFLERLSGEKIVCVLDDELAKKIGPQHQWSDVWNGQNLRIGGELVYGSDGDLKRIHARYYEKMVWADVSLSDLRGGDVLGGKTVQEHLDEFWGKQFG